jgi:hypothetical protein
MSRRGPSETVGDRRESAETGRNRHGRALKDLSEKVVDYAQT